MKVIMFSGSRRLHPGMSIQSILKEEKPDLVIVGDARGVDATVVSVCHELSIPVAKFVANWDKHGRAAGIIRNQDMINAMCSLGGKTLYAFPTENSVGTRHAISRAMYAGLEVHELT